MSKVIKGIIGIIAMSVAVSLMAFVIFPEIDNMDKTNDAKEQDKNYSEFIDICTIPMGEGCDMYYDYHVYPFYCEGPSEYKIGLDGEIMIVDNVSNQVLVYDGNNLRFKHAFDDGDEIATIYCTTDGYVVNYYPAKGASFENASMSFDKNGNVISQNEWYMPENADTYAVDIQDEVVGIVDAIEDEDGVAYARLLKIDEYGNFYLIESRTVAIDSSNNFTEEYICKYNSDGERLGYAIYDYSGRENILGYVDRPLLMDEYNNIYVVDCRRNELVVQRIELGQDDEDMHECRLIAYTEKVKKHLTEGDVVDDGVTWLDIKKEYVYPQDEEKFAKVTDRIYGYIMEVTDEDIDMEHIYRIETYPYDINDFYIQYSDDQVTYKLADDVEVWAYYQYPNQYGIIGIEDIENFEITNGYGTKIEWEIYLNEDRKVQYIFQPYEP